MASSSNSDFDISQLSDRGSARSVRFILGDQLSRDISALTDVDREQDLILLAEVRDEAHTHPHHRKKVALLFASMRHFAVSLAADGFRVCYVCYDDPDNAGSFRGEAERLLNDSGAAQLIITQPGEYRVRADLDHWDLGEAVLEVREDTRFFATLDAFSSWADGRKQLRMEYFYREMRKRTGYLMTDDDEPEGGAWNYDADNRKKIPKGVEPPKPFACEPDEITNDVLKLVGSESFEHCFGKLDGFDFAVDRKGALAALKHFCTHGLPRFGDYQDAMKRADGRADQTLWHSLLSPYMNIGLLSPREVCDAALARYRDGSEDVPLNAIEGFVRQIIGWREYVRGIYWLKMPDYADSNRLDAQRKLPEFYWSGETGMRCLSEAIGQTRELGYAHHIQRLMVTGNFALLYGVRPEDINSWYLAVYVDAFEWVQLPNTHGMVMHADGGYLGSKPYAASGKYIDRQSDYCKSCQYNVKTTSDHDSCPFNALYWRFMEDVREKLGSNPRMSMIYRSWDKMASEKRAATLEKAQRTLAALEAGDSL